MLTFVAELFRIRAKVRFAAALERLGAAMNLEEKEKETKALRRIKAHMGWRNDLKSITICLVPSLVYFFLFIVPEPTMQAGCVGCVSKSNFPVSSCTNKMYSLFSRLFILFSTESTR